MLQWIAFLAVVCALSVALNRRFERVLAPALCGLMLLLYVLAIPRVLSWVDWIAPVLLALTVALAIARTGLTKADATRSCGALCQKRAYARHIVLCLPVRLVSLRQRTHGCMVDG